MFERHESVECDYRPCMCSNYNCWHIDLLRSDGGALTLLLYNNRGYALEAALITAGNYLNLTSYLVYADENAKYHKTSLHFRGRTKGSSLEECYYYTDSTKLSKLNSS